MEKNLPIYEVEINSIEEGVYQIAMVDAPAIRSNFVAFKEEKELQKFSIQNEEKRIVSGAIMIPNFPIYRRDKNGFEYYLTYSADVIRLMGEKMLSDATFKNINAEHTDEMLDGVNLIELYIKDSEKGISPSFLDVPDGTLIASFKVHNDSVWNEIKNGTFKGFSIEGLFSIDKEDSEEKILEEILSQIKKLRKVK